MYHCLLRWHILSVCLEMVCCVCLLQGILYDLLECIIGFLDNQGLSHVPVYYVSPMAKSSLAYANIYAEWWVGSVGSVSVNVCDGCECE